MSNVWQTKIVKIADLFLDEVNIRIDNDIDGALSQDALIHDLFINQGSYVLAQSIAKHGLFQHELPIVIQDGNRLIVIEGNRRVAALKGIYQPNLIPSFASKLEQLKKSNHNLPITDLEVKIAPSRDAVMQLLAAIHTTESRKPWATLRQAYFYYAQIGSGSRTLQQLIDEYPNVDVPRFVRMWEMHRIARSISYDRPEEAAKVANQQEFPITTLERIYDNDSFQKDFGVSFNSDGRVKIVSDKKSFGDSFKKIIQDIVNREVTSRTLNKAEEVKKYLARLSKPRVSKSRAFGARSFKPIPPAKLPRQARGLVPKDITCLLPYPGIERILKELQKLDYNKFPNAAHDLLRTFLECSLKAYFDNKGITVSSKRPHIYLNDVLATAESEFAKLNRSLVQPIKVIRSNASQTYLYSQDYLNALNHNPNVFSRGDNVKDAWDSMENVIRYVLKP